MRMSCATNVIALVVGLNSPTALADDFDGCGFLIQGVECVLFQADSGGVYVLDNYGSFEVGDRVHVAGVLDPYCITFCMQGDGCILDNTIGPCECLGDLDYDGDVDLSDLAQLLANYGTTSGASYEDGDIEGDGDVDLSDLAALLANYGTTCE